VTATRIAAASPLARVIDVLETFDQASPSLVDERALQQRIDRKYLLTPDLSACILAQLWSHYHVLRTAGAVAARYESVYFDTDEHQFYYDHHRGRLPRHKVRIRRHVDRELAFLEIKRKEKSGRTVKARLDVPFDRTSLGPVEREFIEAHASIDTTPLRPRVTIWFLRTTLMGALLNERLTFDWDVRFRDTAGASGGVPGVSVVELKQARYSQRSVAVDTFRAMQIREHALSKYCLATSRLTTVRDNRFKPTVRLLEKLLRCESC
jgi:hypothetical protein